MSSTPMPWIKLYTDLLDDTKIGELPDLTKLRFIQLLLVAGECDAEGELTNGTSAMTVSRLAWRLRIDQKQLADDIKVLCECGLMSNQDGVICIVNFSKRQGRTQSERREQWRRSQQRTRAKDTGEDAPKEDEKDDSQGKNNVNDDSTMSQPSREEKSREEKEESRKEISAKAPPKKSSRKTKPKLEPDPRSQHPAIQAVREVTERYPAKELYDEIITVCGESPNLQRMRLCWIDWLKVSTNRANMTWLLEWYAQGASGNPNQHRQQPPPSRQPPAQQNDAERARLKAEAQARIQARVAAQAAGAMPI